MNKKVLVLFFFLFFFFYTLNCLTPLCFGDDYVYAFVWEGHSMFEPMSEQVRRLSSFYDLLQSQWSHYFTGNGRAVSHTLVQFFLWVGKDVFNVFNALIPILLIIEIYWFANKGVIAFDFKKGIVAFVFFALWAFTPSFPSVFLWLSGACNYLWTAVLLLGFLLPYVYKYYFFEEMLVHSSWFPFAMFGFGIIAGWTNENSVCWIILVLTAFIYKNKTRSGIETWMFTGLAGMVVGYALMMLAPGNMMRLSVQVEATGWLTWKNLTKHAALLFLLLVYFHIFPWYFVLRSFYSLRGKSVTNIVLSKEVALAKVMCVVSFCMTFMMLFSPNFQTRSVFPGTVLLIIAVTILLRVQNEYNVIIISETAKKFLCILGAVYFIITAPVAFYGSYFYRTQMDELISFVKSDDSARHNIVVVNSLRPVPDMIDKASFFHLIFNNLKPDENDWHNVAFSRYYEIKGIRMMSKEQDTNE